MEFEEIEKHAIVPDNENIKPTPACADLQGWPVVLISFQAEAEEHLMQNNEGVIDMLLHTVQSVTQVVETL